MSRKIRIICLFVLLFCSSGCGISFIESPEVKLCNKLGDVIDKYDNQQITYNNFAQEVVNESNTFCNENEDSNVCLQIKWIKTQSEYDYTLEDCSSKASTPIDLKKMCETTNNLKKDMIAKKDQTEKAYVSELKHQCNIVKEK